MGGGGRCEDCGYVDVDRGSLFGSGGGLTWRDLRFGVIILVVEWRIGFWGYSLGRWLL